ncbi:MAG: 5'/3'-nucleotidase SurE [Myxococcales bacterium]
MRILLSNDDGIFAEGLRALYDALAPIAEVWVVAPDREQSASSHSITLHRPLRIRQQGERWFAVDGTPTDCVFVAVNHLMREHRPDVVCSGINHGANLGNDVIYSGTVAAAMEGALLGISSIAFSHVGRSWDFPPRARFAAQLVNVVAENPLPRSTLLNVNFPPGPARGYAFTTLGKRSYGEAVIEKTDPRGRLYYWIGGSEASHEDIPGSDCNAVFDDSLVSVTPLNLDFTDHPVLEVLRTWDVPGYDKWPGR